MTTDMQEAFEAAVLEILDGWKRAYPLAVFPEPPPGEHGCTVDACSARAIRHAVESIDKEIREAMDEVRAAHADAEAAKKVSGSRGEMEM